VYDLEKRERTHLSIEIIHSVRFTVMPIQISMKIWIFILAQIPKNGHHFAPLDAGVNLPHIANYQNFFQEDPKWISRNFKKEKALKTLFKSSFMQNFSPWTHFWNLFKKISGFFRKPLQRISKYSKFEYATLYLAKQNMFMQIFSSLACTQTDFNTFLSIFEENFMIFQENSLANS
jgi:hypothetical protein